MKKRRTMLITNRQKTAVVFHRSPVLSRALLLVAALLAAPWADATLFVYRGPHGEKMVTNVPRYDYGYKLLGQDETVEGVGKFMGRKGWTAADLPAWASSKNYHRKWVNSSEFDGYIRTAALKYDVDPSLVKAVIQVESNFDPDAISRAGARGLMQLMPGTAAQYSLGMQQINNPQRNIDAGVRHLAYLKTLFPNNLAFVVAAYNAGENNVIKYNGIPPFPETVDYVQKVKYSHNIFKRVFY
ncbi:MAG: lytic transglycosylase domain-containing protein [Pseudomonadales bacterium]|nr:lytic transglycosylase domain-containing protein [Pseudomonadales bacterium]